MGQGSIHDLPAAGQQDPQFNVGDQALVRGCREELAIILPVGWEFMEVVHAYPDITIHLTLFNTVIAKGIPQRLEPAALTFGVAFKKPL